MGDALEQLQSFVWPLSRLGEAFAALALPRAAHERAAPLPDATDTAAFDLWLSATAAAFELETEPATLPYSGLADCLRVAGPTLLRVREGCIILLPKSRVLAPDRSVDRVSLDALASSLSAEIEAPVAAQVDDLVESVGVPERRRARVRNAIIRERLASRQIGGCWLLRLPPGSDFRRQLTENGIQRRLIILASAHFIQYALFIASWWVVGLAALHGRLDRPWLFAWALLLFTIIPVRMLTSWLQGSIAILAGAALKQRLLAGALRLDPDEIRSEGAGQLLGRVLESQQVEALALSGGFLALVASLELLLAALVLIAGHGWLVITGLLVWLAATVVIARQYLRRNDIWTGARLAMTHELIEKMVGHRTRLAQERPDRWHAGEDHALHEYLHTAQSLDRAAARLAVVPRAWLVLGTLALAPAFIAGTASSAQLAIAVGGILLAYRALKRLSGGLWQLAGAAIAWRRTAMLFHAAARPELRGAAVTEPAASPDIFQASDLVFRYRSTGEPILRNCNLRIAHGDRLLLEGPSGAGKSTLAAVVTGLRTPQSGRVLLKGLDRQHLGSEAWRRAVVSAPQFHENHVLTGTFAFNLMMGSRWPPHPEDFLEMESICRELGLGELLQRMPAGLLQCVGDTGWQLSHGERSRLYIARALLQKPELVVLDESFAALDPENLRCAMNCVLARASSVMVVAHP